MSAEEILFTVDSIRAVRFHADNVEAAQAFAEANPAYNLLAVGVPPQPGDARRELTDFPPAIQPEDAYFLGIWENGELAAVASVARTWPVAGISHVGLFHVAESLHGRGVAAGYYAALEQWMVSEFKPRWLRLGVIASNARALRFWSRVGFHETGRRRNLPYGQLKHDIVVMIKPMQGETDNAYWPLAASGPATLETPAPAAS